MSSPIIPFNDPRVIKQFNAEEKKNLPGYLILMVVTLISIGFSISYAYLGSTGIHFPSWGGPFLITMGSLGLLKNLLTFLGFFDQEIKIVPPHAHKEEKKVASLINTHRLSTIALSFLGLIASAIYIYLGSQGSSFPSWGSDYLITLGALGSASVVGHVAFSIFVYKKESKVFVWKSVNNAKNYYISGGAPG